MAREGLNPDDPGIRLLAEAVADTPPAQVVLVCGGSLPGLGAGATRLITDVREEPTAGERCLPFSFSCSSSSSSSFDELLGQFSAAVVWPRAHLGKDFSIACIAQAARLLRPGGRLLCAVRKNKGAASLGATICQLVDNSTVIRRDRGYALYAGIRGAAIDEAAARALLEVRYAIDDPLLGPPPLVTTPGVFSRKHLDRGTRALLDAAGSLAESGALGQPERVLDLCAGVGPLGLWAARRWPQASVTAIESNLLAVACLRTNGEARGLLGEAPRLTVAAADGLRGLDLRPFDLALVNPPTHAGEEELRELLAPLPELLRGGRALFVVNRSGRLVSLLRELDAAIDTTPVPGFVIVSARW